jgi:hypothetical protein
LTAQQLPIESISAYQKSIATGIKKVEEGNTKRKVGKEEAAVPNLLDWSCISRSTRN